MKKFASSTKRKNGYLRFIGMTAFVLAAAVFINALPTLRAQASNVSLFGLANLFSWNAPAPQATVVQQADESDAPQTVLINETFEGGVGAFTIVNSANSVNDWVVGAATASGGAQSAYISNNGGTTNAYTNTDDELGTHISAPFTVPAGESAIVLAFDWKGIMEHSTDNNVGSGSAWDYLRVSVTAAVPVGGALPALADQLPVIYNGQSGYTRAYVVLPAALAGAGARNLVFSFRNDTSGGSTAPAIDNIVLTSTVPTPLSGTKTIQAGGDYTSIGEAFAFLSANGADTTGGNLTFNVAAGQTFNQAPPLLTASGSATGRIIFQKSGAGANPLVIATGSGNYGPPNATTGSNTGDAVIAVGGGDYITFDGIDVQGGALVGTTATTTAQEYGYYFRNASATNGAQNNIVQNTNITLNRVNTAGVGILQNASTLAAGFAATSAAGSNTNNKYYNFSIQNVFAGVQLLGTAAFPDDLTGIGVTGAVTQNTIGSATANDIGGGALQTWGIRAAGQSNVKIFKNEIRNVGVTSTSATVAVDGIFLDNTGSSTVSIGTAEIYGNNIHDIRHTGTSTTSHVVSGIRSNVTNNAASVSRIYNNFVYGLQNSSANTTARQTIGIRIQDSGSGAAGTQNIVNNSVRIAPTVLTSQNAAFELQTSTTGPVVNVQNNIFANFTAAQSGAAKHYAIVASSATAFGNAGSVSNYNDLYVVNTNGFVGLANATDKATLTDWRATYTPNQDLNSISADPLFTSPTDLHIGSSSPAKDTGTTISYITDDIDAQARPAGVAYDMGADEFVVVALPGTFQFSSAAYGGNEGTSVTVTVTRTNGSVGAVTVPYTTSDGTGIGGGACGVGIDYIDNDGTLSFADGQTSATFTVQLCSDAVLDNSETINLALGAPSSGNLGAQNTAVLTITDVPPPFSGTYNVGTGQTYTSLTNAGGIFAAINSTGANGNITINIASDLTAETGAVALNEIAGGYTVLIQPTGARTISGTVASALIKLNGADGVTIDGLNTGGNSLAITNTNTSGSGIWLASLGTGLGATNNTIRNTTITGGASTAGIGICVGGATLCAAGADNDGNTITGNNILKVATGIAVNGTAAVSAGGDDTLLINNNIIGPATAGTNNIGGTGIIIGNAVSPSLSGNTVRNVVSTGQAIGIALNTGAVGGTVTQSTITNVSSSTAATTPPIIAGLFISSTSVNSLITQNTITNVSGSATVGVVYGILENAIGVQLLRNNVSGIINSNPSGYAARGIFVSTGVANSNVTLANNMVSDIQSYSDPTVAAMPYQPVGIFLTGATAGVNLFYNSVNLFGPHPGLTGVTVQVGLFVDASVTGLDVQNNIFSNSYDNSTSATDKSYAFYSAAPASAYTTINYNDYYVSGAAGVLAFFGGADVTTLTALQTATGQDANSISANPQFLSNTNLHINTAVATPVSNAGTPVAVTDDFDGDVRDGSTPDIGADEGTFITPVTNDISATAILVPSGMAAVGASITPQASFTNNGTDTQTGVMVQFNISGPGGYTYTDTQTIASITPGQTLTVTFAAAPTFTTQGAYTDSAVVLTADQNAGNNTVTGSFQVLTPLGGNYNVGTGGNYTSLSNPGGIFEAINNLGTTSNIVIKITTDLTGETGAIGLNEVAGGFTVSITPDTTAKTITGSSAAAIIKLNGADNVTVDGSVSGGTDRSLTITNTGGGAGVWVASTTAPNGATNNIVKNLNVVGGGGTVTSFGIISSGSALGTAAEAANSTNTYQNNAVSASSYGIVLVGAVSNDIGNSVTGNNVGSTVLASKIGLVGIYFANQATGTVSANTVAGATSASTTTPTSGITVLGTQSGTTIDRNRISDIKNTNTSGYGANGIQLSAAAASNITVSNNFIYDVAGYGYASGFGINDNGYGIIITGGGGYNVWHNSVNMNTNQTVAGNAVALNVTAGVTAAGAINLQNNILANTQTAGSTRYAIYSLAPSTVFSPINYNDYFTTGSALGFIGSSRATLADIQTGFGGNANSQAVNPMFVSPTNLHLTATANTLINGGTSVGITNDFDNDPRPSGTAPDIGADEVTEATGGVIPAGTYYNVVAAGGDTLGGDVTITGSLTLNGILTPGANMLTFGCGATAANAGAGNYVDGTVSKNYCGSETFVYPVGTTGGTNPGYSPMTAAISAATAGSNLSVDAVDATLPGLNGPDSVSRYWSLNETGDVTATSLSFTYLPGDIGATATESDFRVFRNSGGLTNFCSPAGPGCASGNTATTTVSPITSFSPWGVGELLAPTAASVDVSGRIREANGRGVSRARVTMTNSEGEVRMAYTNQFGYFRFGGVPAGDNYIFSATHIRYQFAQSALVRFISEDTDNVNFTASGENPDFNAEARFFENAPFDFDGDGRTDVSVYRNSNNTWYIKRSSDNTLFTQAFGAAGDRLAPADFDGDGKTDLAVFRPSEGNWYIWMSASNSLLTETLGTAADRPMAADFDGDRKADISVWNEMRGVWQVKLSTNGTIVSEKFVNGKGNFTPLASDRNGDGKADFVFFNSLNATWTIRTSAGVNIKEQFGAAGDRAAMGDFDGDAKGDLAVYRAGENVWTIKLANGKELTDLRISANADNAVVGDFDGDGKYDAAGFGGGVWSVLQSVNNMVRQQQFGLADDQVIPAVR